jgi:predicted dienelactone hydrolase
VASCQVRRVPGRSLVWAIRVLPVQHTFANNSMRPFEIILIILVIATALTLMTKLTARWPIFLTLLGVLAAPWHIVGEKTHWQMFPVLAGLALLVAWHLVPTHVRVSRYRALKNPLALVAAALSVASLGLLVLIPMFSLPNPTGPYLVGTRTMYLKDTTRAEDDGGPSAMPRELMVQIWYPAAPSHNRLAAYQTKAETTLWTSYRDVLWTNSKADAPIATKDGLFNVLLFNHGWGGRRTQDTFLTEDLASHGYVVAAIDHTYNAGRVAMPDGRVIDDIFGSDPINTELRTAAQIRDAWDKELSKWVADETFVLNTLQNENLDPKSFWYGRLDTERAGAFGHSFGGAASVQVCSVDARIRSALNMDGWTFGDIRHRASNQPIMFMYQAGSMPRPQDLISNDRTVRTEAELDVGDMKQIDSSLNQYGGYKLYVSNASHMDFTDHPLVFPWRNWLKRSHIAPARVQTIVRAYVLAFFDQTLRGEQPALLQFGDSSPFHEVQIKHFAPVPNAAPAETRQPPHLATTNHP